MANLVFDFLHNYKTGERRESDPADAYQYDEGHVFEAVVPVAVTSCEIHYWARGFDEAEAYTPASITQNTDNSYTITGNIPNKFFETYGDLRVYIVVTDGDASITTYEGRIHICERSKPDDYVDDDPDNEATRVLVEAQEAAATATQKAADAATSAEQAAESARTLTLDTTLTQSGQAADAKAAGDAINDLEEDLNEVTEQTYNLLLSVISGASINSSGYIYGDSNYDLGIAPIELNEKYTVKTNDSSLVCGFFSAVPEVGSTSYDGSRLIQSSKTFIAPCNGYIAFRMLADYSQPQIVEGTSDKDYISPISAIDYIARESSASAIENVNVKPRNINNGIFKNMLDPSDIVDGYYVDHSNGTYNNQSSTYWRSGFIPVKPNTSYTSNSYNRIAFYDENKSFISGSGHYGDYSYVSPNNAAYIMVCNTPLTSKSKYVLAETANYDGLYYPFGVRIPWLIESKSRLEGKKMVCFGDSITNMGYVDTILENSGIIAENVGLSSGRYANVDNATIDAFSFYNIIYAIANNDWTIPDSLSGQTGYETQYAHIQAMKAIDFSEIEYASFAYGTNDFSSSTPIDNENDPYDPNYFMGAMRYCIKTFLQKYPHIKLLVATPCYRFWQESGVFVDDCNTHEIGGKKLSDYVDAEISVCKEMHIPYVDNLTCAGINQYNRTQYFDANDGLHPNAKGRAIIGGRITDGIFYNY